MEAQASPVQAGASPAPNLGSGFTSAWLSPKGGETPGGLAPPLPRHLTAPLPRPASHPGNPQDGWWKRVHATQEGPVTATCSEPIPLLAALGPHLLPLTSLRGRGRDPGPRMKRTAGVRRRRLECCSGGRGHLLSGQEAGPAC